MCQNGGHDACIGLALAGSCSVAQANPVYYATSSSYLATVVPFQKVHRFVALLSHYFVHPLSSGSPGTK